MAVSSAKKLDVTPGGCGKSIMWSTNNLGPRTNPYGIPVLMLVRLEDEEL